MTKFLTKSAKINEEYVSEVFREQKLDCKYIFTFNLTNSFRRSKLVGTEIN